VYNESLSEFLPHLGETQLITFIQRINKENTWQLITARQLAQQSYFLAIPQL
jgi:hypothetical protein